jgi:protein-tyrosine phosphatase
MIRVLFVCMGNICRSPAAEAIFQKLIEDAGIAEHFHLDSAAIGAWHVGQRAHPQTLATLRKHGIEYQGRSRQVTRDDLETFDYIYLADREVETGLRRYGSAGRAEPALLLTAAYEKGVVATDEIPDPNYTGQFDAVHELIEAGCRELLARIRAERGI